MNLISDHGENDPLEFDLTGWQPVAHGIRKTLKAQQDERYRAQLEAWAAIPDTSRTDADRAAIAADQARRIRAMGGR